MDRFTKHNTETSDSYARNGARVVRTRLPVHTSPFCFQGPVAFTTAFELFSRPDENVKFSFIFKKKVKPLTPEVTSPFFFGRLKGFCAHGVLLADFQLNVAWAAILVPTTALRGLRSFA